MADSDTAPGGGAPPAAAASGGGDWSAVASALARRLNWLMPGLAPAELADLAREGLIDLIRASRREPIRDVEATLHALARRKIVDHARRRARWGVLLEALPGDTASVHSLPAAFGGPAQRVAFVILEVLDQAGSSCEPLARAYLAGHEWAEVAAACGRSEGAVERQWSRCVAHVHRILQESPGNLWSWAASDEETYHG